MFQSIHINKYKRKVSTLLRRASGGTPRGSGGSVIFLTAPPELECDPCRFVKALDELCEHKAPYRVFIPPRGLDVAPAPCGYATDSSLLHFVNFFTFQKKFVTSDFF